ncbi:QueT transporter family protein [Streptococcus dentiloxodontae]
MKELSIRDLAQIAIVAAIYVVLTVTPPLNAISYGPYQFRISEMLNFLAFYNRKYILAVTLGCVIANFFAYGWIDVLVGGGSTLLFVSLGVWLFDKFNHQEILGGLMIKSHLYFAFFFSASMITVAAELAYFGSPFLLTWFTTAVGELASLLVGAILIKRLAGLIDFTL